MPALPTTQDVRHVRKQAEAGVTATIQVVKSPLLAALGAVDAATKAVVEVFGKATGDYREAAQRTYASLIDRGAEVFGEFRSQPRVQQALDSVESGVDAAQERLEIAVREVNAAVEDLRSRFALTSRSVGERISRGTEQVATTVAGQAQDSADEAAEAVHDAGREAATETRGAARRVADRAAPPRKAVTRRPGDNNTRKS